MDNKLPPKSSERRKFVIPNSNSENDIDFNGSKMKSSNNRKHALPHRIRQVIDKFTSDNSAFDALTHFLRRANSASNVDLRSPFFDKDLPRPKIVEKFDAIFNLKMKDLAPELVSLELAERKKISPFSIRLSWADRKSTVLPYFAKKSWNPDPDCFRKAVETTKKLLPLHRIRPISLDRAYQMSPKSTNWGLPFFKRGKEFGHLYVQEAQDFLNNRKIIKYPCVLGWRGQPSGTDIPKQRVVWMYPHSIVLLELMFLRPLLEELRMTPEFAAWNQLHIVDSVVSRIIRFGVELNQPIIGIDFSAYDASLHPELVKASYDCLRAWVQSDYHWLLDILQDYLITSDLLTPDTLFTHRNGGMPSGSGFTNLTDSMCQIIAFHYTAERLNVPEHLRMFTVCGDDGVWLLPGLTPRISNELSAELGLTSHPDKQSFGNYAMFCQRIFLPEYSSSGVYPGIRSLYRTLNGMLSYETRPGGGIWIDKMDTCRWISQIENSANHPLFEDFVEFAIQGDSKYHLGRGYPGGIKGLFRDTGGVKKLLDVTGSSSFIYSQAIRSDDDLSKLKIAKYINR